MTNIIDNQLGEVEGFERLEALFDVIEEEDFNELSEEDVQEYIDELEELQEELEPFMDQLTKEKINKNLTALNELLN